MMAPQVEEAVQALVAAAGDVDEVVVGLDGARQHLEQRELPDEGVGDGAEHVRQGLAGLESHVEDPSEQD